MSVYLDNNGLLYVLTKLGQTFVEQQTGMGLSHNDLTDTLLAKINAAGTSDFDGTWSSLTGKPTAISTWTNDSGYQTDEEVADAISDALAELSTGLFVIVAALPDVEDADPNKIYLAPATTTGTGNGYDEWIVADDAWEKIGSTSLDLTGYLNTTNHTAMTNTQIDTAFTNALT